MISPKFFIDALASRNIDFFAGVPDSLLKNICAYITDNLPKEQNIIAANEGGAMGMAAGYHLATGKIPCVYMQNSGEGNIINPLASLTDREVYGIPVLLLIGWRGRPGVHDEPQHVKQGKVTTGLLNTMSINYTILSKDEDQAYKQISEAHQYMTDQRYSWLKGIYDELGRAGEYGVRLITYLIGMDEMHKIRNRFIKSEETNFIANRFMTSEFQFSGVKEEISLEMILADVENMPYEVDGESINVFQTLFPKSASQGKSLVDLAEPIWNAFAEFNETKKK